MTEIIIMRHKTGTSCLIALVCALLFPGVLLSQESHRKFDLRGNFSENYVSQGLKFTIHSDRNRYSTGEKIVIQCKISNTGIYPITLYMHEDYIRNFTLVVRNPAGQSMPMRDIHYYHKETAKQTYYGDYTGTRHRSRAIILQPGESLIRDLVLNDVVQLDKMTGAINRLEVMAYFYPNIEQAAELYVPSSNEYLLYVDTYSDRTDALAQSQDFHSLPLAVQPKEVIYLALTAEYLKDWPNFFKYIDLHEYIRDYPEYARQFMQSPPENRAAVLEGFKKYLIGNNNHKLVRFEVVSEELSSGGAEVKVKATREIDGFERDFVYTYYLSPRENLWQISGVDSQLTK